MAIVRKICKEFFYLESEVNVREGRRDISLRYRYCLRSYPHPSNLSFWELVPYLNRNRMPLCLPKDYLNRVDVKLV
jgi:hypothetical protein